MSGANISYNLRPNKFVERQLFVELLSKVCQGKSPDDYVYVSLAGPQLEDQRLIHHRLGIKNLFSIEEDIIVYKRQLFNLRPSFIKCWNKTTEDFINDFDTFADKFADKKFIIWLDYATANERRKQLVEYETLLSKLAPGDIVKVTLNANPNTLGERFRNEPIETIQKRQLETLKSQLEGYLPDSIDHTQMRTLDFAPILSRAVQKASVRAVENNPSLRPVPVAIFSYNDAYHQMLTVTVTIVKEENAEELIAGLPHLGWDFMPDDWSNVNRINVPNLTAKERLYIEELLFSEHNGVIHANLPFKFDIDNEKSLEILEEYARHYTRYPSYFQVIL